jgi:hypothetical protein
MLVIPSPSRDLTFSLRVTPIGIWVTLALSVRSLAVFAGSG